VPAGSGGLNRSIGIAFGPDVNGDTVPEAYVFSFNSDEVMRHDGATGAPLGIAGNPTSAVFVTQALGGLDNPEFLTFGPDGNLYVVRSATNQVFRYSSTTGALIDVFVTASNNGGLAHPLAAAFGPDGNLYVTGSDSDNVIRYNGATGAFMNVFVSAGSGGLNRPEVLTFGPDGNLSVSSSLTNQVLRYSGTTGAFLDAFVPAGSGGLNFPTGLTFGSDGHLYVASANNDRVLRYHGSTGTLLDTIVPAGAGGLDRPTGLAFGADARLYVTTADTSEVLRVTKDAAPDYYRVTMAAGQTLTVTSSTPADGPGQFANSLDPILELYDASFTLVASGTTLADGRNEQVQWTASSGGFFYIKIRSGSMTRGEYVLDVLMRAI
jgi:glucose/arabinose dehydrogenase